MRIEAQAAVSIVARRALGCSAQRPGEASYGIDAFGVVRTYATGRWWCTCRWIGSLDTILLSLIFEFCVVTPVKLLLCVMHVGPFHRRCDPWVLFA